MAVSTSINPIPQFGLYGESNIDDPVFVHVENIASRSRDNGWSIQPHRHGRMFQIIFVFDGAAEVTIDDQKQSLTGPFAISLPAGVVHGFRFSPETEGVVLTLAEPLLTNESYERCEPYFGSLFAGASVISLVGQELIVNEIQGYLGMIERELASVEMGHSLVSEWLARATLMQLRRLLVADAESTPSLQAAKPVIRYRKLIEQHLFEHLSVEQYASFIGISADHLNRLCKQEVGKTAKAMVQERLLLEAKRRLVFTRGSVEELAFDLGFKDPAYFSRFFKKLTDQTPAAYRSAHNYDSN